MPLVLLVFIAFIGEKLFPLVCFQGLAIFELRSKDKEKKINLMIDRQLQASKQCGAEATSLFLLSLFCQISLNNTAGSRGVMTELWGSYRLFPLWLIQCFLGWHSAITVFGLDVVTPHCFDLLTMLQRRRRPRGLRDDFTFRGWVLILCSVETWYDRWRSCVAASV